MSILPPLRTLLELLPLEDRVVPATVTVVKIQDGTEGGADGLFRFARTGPTTDPLVVQVGVGGTAEWDVDYTGLSDPTSVTIDSGNSTVDLWVDVEDDSVTEFGETVVVTVLADAAYTVGGPSSATVTIFDNEGSQVYWIGGSGGSWSNWANWSSLSVPGPTDAVYFSGAYSSYGVTIPSTVTQLGELHFINNYTGTVTVSNNLSVGRLEMASAGAKLDQPTPGSGISGTDVTVTAAMLWTAGTINGTTYTSIVNILGNGSIAPADYGTLITGSTLNFVAADPATPTTTTVQPGTVRFNNAAAAIVGNAATVKVQVAVNNPGLIEGFGQQDAKSWWINAGGSLEYVGTGTASNTMPIVNNGGQFKLNGQVTLTLSGGNNALEKPDYSQIGSGRLHIVNGSTLTVTNHVRIAGSDSSVLLIMNPDLPAHQQTATINGKFKLVSGTISFSPPITIGTTLTYGTFTVNGDVNWTGGRYFPGVDYTTAGLANKWIVNNGTLTSAAACVIEPNPRNGVNPPASSAWDVVDANATAGVIASPPAGCPLTIGEHTVGLRKKWKFAS